MSEQLPEQFGRYRIIKRLGQGGMGSVYLAEDTQLRRQVALKVPDFGPQDGPEARKRFLEEARTAATLDHQYLCPVHDVGEIDGRLYLTMAYIEGNSLAELTQGKSFTPRQVAALVGKLALAMQEAHAKKVIHRDLKPANVMIKATGQRREPVIVDFGLAHRDDPEEQRLTRSGQIMGTLGYMAPEQIRGDLKEIGPACDIYALGVILYELLTGRLPFRGSGLAVVGQILTVTPPPPSTHRSDLDPALEAICLKAMSREVGDRYTSMGELAAAVTGYLRSPSATPMSTSPTGPMDASAPNHGEPSRPTGSSSLVGKFLDQLGEHRVSSPPLPDPGRDASAIRLPGGRWPLRTKIAAAVVLIVLGVILVVAIDKGRIAIGVNPSALITNTIGMKLVLVTAGDFLMGSTSSDRDAEDDEKPQHRVEITRPFYLGAHEVTQGQYNAVMGANPSRSQGSVDSPVDNVSWGDAISFCNRLSVKEGLEPYYRVERQDVASTHWDTQVSIRGGDGYRLPTEAEWEYACRAGSTTRYSFGDDDRSLDVYAWYGGNSGKKLPPVGLKRPNAWGLYDLHGNVWEWCWDSYDVRSYRTSPDTDPLGPSQTSGRVIRGGSWYDEFPRYARSANRGWSAPGNRGNDLGFRVVRGQSGR